MAMDNERFAQVREHYEQLRLTTRSLVSAEDWPAALEHAQRAFDYLEEQQNMLGYVFEAAVDLAVVHGSSGDWASAERLLERCFQVRGIVHGEMGVETATAAMMLGVAKHQLEKYGEAEELIQHSLRIRMTILGVSHPHVALALMNLAAVYDKTGRAEAAAELRQRAERIRLTPGRPS